MQILRVTTFKWGDTVNNWYPDREAVLRQLATEKDRPKSPDVVATNWYEVRPIAMIVPAELAPKS